MTSSGALALAIFAFSFGAEEGTRYHRPWITSTVPVLNMLPGRRDEFPRKKNDEAMRFCEILRLDASIALHPKQSALYSASYMLSILNLQYDSVRLVATRKRPTEPIYYSSATTHSMRIVSQQRVLEKEDARPTDFSL